MRFSVFLAASLDITIKIAVTIVALAVVNGVGDIHNKAATACTSEVYRSSSSKSSRYIVVE